MNVRVLTGDCRTRLAELEPQSVHCIVTSPPYFGLRDYGVAGQIGLEPSPEDYIAELVAVFREAKRALRDDGTLWLNLGDSYATQPGKGSNVPQTKHPKNDYPIAAAHRSRPIAGCKPKDLLGIPWSVAFALRADGWWLRSDIIWHKPNPMPESVTDRPTSAHEHVFLLAKSERYYFDAEAVKEPAVYADADRPDSAVYKDARSYNGKHTDKQRGHGRRHAGFNARWDAMSKAQQCGAYRNIRNVWTIATEPYSEAHFATFPPSLIEPCIKAGTSEKGVCGKCRAPWVRQIDVESRPNAPPCNGKYDGKGKHRTISGGVSNDSRARLDKGWSPSCACGAEPVPATVLDPFGGAGTTGLVADRLKRNAVLIELNPSYAEMARNRIREDAGMFGEVA